MKTSLFKTTLLICSSFSLIVGCSKATDADKIADAQSCLDTVAPADAPTCVAKVEGIESAGAYLIRCAGKYVKEGFSTPSKLASTLASVNGKDTDASGSTAMMAVLAFKAEATTALNAASAQEASEFCKKSGSKGLIQLAELSNISTTLTSLSTLITNTSNLTGDDVKTIMNELQTNPAAQQAVGSAIVTMYESSCTNNGTASGNYCAQFEAAAASVGGMENTTALGQQAMKCYSNPTLPECAAFQ